MKIIVGLKTGGEATLEGPSKVIKYILKSLRENPKWIIKQPRHPISRPSW